ncbi:MAG TPA: VWA domain-containing protein [Blastocatellia bacterium]|nr:VWA domain-containing protein [Blastocatellia bacterium]
MKSWVSFLVGLALVVPFNIATASAFQSGAGRQEDRKQEEQKVVIGTSEVVLDVVVRDKKGRPVKDLGKTDFEIYEDGVKQNIESFRLYQREAGREATPAVGDSGKAAAPSTSAPHPATVTARSPFEGVSVVALVFDRLSPNARELAHKAAASYVSETLKRDDLAGVFAIDLSLHVVQPYTNDTRLLSSAVDRAVSISANTFASNAAQASQQMEQAGKMQEQADAATGAAAGAGGQSAGAAAAAAGASNAAAQLAQLQANMLNTFEVLERNEQGYATTNALLSIISPLGNIPGRKAIIFFSEGLSIPTAVEHRFRSVINAANRANVTFYPIDAAGLRATSVLVETSDELKGIANQRSRQVATGREDRSGRPMSTVMERNENLLRSNPEGGLGQLADETGGFLIRDKNNLSAGLVHIDEDMRSHYVLTYVPKNQDYDGKFRQVSVKLSRSGLDLQTRKGYFALRSAGSSPVLDYEAPALAALYNPKSKGSVSIKATALSFPEQDRPGLVPVLVETPANWLTYAVDSQKNTYSADFTIVALVKDQSGQVVSKLSQHYLLSGPADKVDSAKRGEILFYREAQLGPGKYTVDAVGYEAPTGKAGVASANVDVPRIDAAALRLSSVVVLKRAERLSAADQKENNPFHYGEVLIYPNMGEAINKSAKQLAFFFDVYTVRGASNPPKLTIEVDQGGKAMAQASQDLPAADAGGRIQYASALPIDGFKPGDYLLKITVTDGKSSASRSVGFSVQL